MKRKIIQQIRTFVIWHTCGLMNWVSEHICYQDVTRPVGWRDRLRWCIEGKLNTVFGWAWEGSDEELQAVDNDEVPVRYMSDRQLAYFNQEGTK